MSLCLALVPTPDTVTSHTSSHTVKCDVHCKADTQLQTQTAHPAHLAFGRITPASIPPLACTHPLSPHTPFSQKKAKGKEKKKELVCVLGHARVKQPARTLWCDAHCKPGWVCYMLLMAAQPPSLPWRDQGHNMGLVHAAARDSVGETKKKEKRREGSCCLGVACTSQWL